MLLTLDIGNTNIKLALFDDDNLVEFRIYPDIDKLFKYIKTNALNEIAICSVNPTITKTLVEEISKSGISIFQANIQNRFNLQIKYSTPETLGIDRVCSVVGAFEIAVKENLILKNHYLLTIDFGTATTINVVSPEGYFLGGLIAPGVKTMLKSLNEETAQLPIPELRTYKGIIGDTTDSSIVSGVINATIGMIDKTVQQLKVNGDLLQPILFATGGNAQFILPHIKYKILYEEALVLKGLKVIYDLNKKIKR